MIASSLFVIQSSLEKSIFERNGKVDGYKNRSKIQEGGCMIAGLRQMHYPLMENLRPCPVDNE